MKLTLINLWKATHTTLALPYIASYIKKYSDVEIEIIEEDKGILDKIKTSKPDIIGFNAYTPNYLQVVEISKQIKEHLDTPIIVGGPHITSLPFRLSEYIDIGVIGEGEETMLELIYLYKTKNRFDEEDLKQIKGITFYGKKGIIVTERREPIEPLDRIPFPDRDLLDMEYYLNPNNDILSTQEKIRGTNMVTSRGCPYNCIYCQSKTIWGKARFHSAKYVADEIYMLHNKYRVKAIAIDDDLFIADKQRLKNIVNILDKWGLLGWIKFYCSGRANLIDEECVSLLKKLNVVQINLGFETGSDRLLKYLKNNTVTIEQHNKAVKLLTENNIFIYGNFMLGSPTETKEEMLQTLKFFKNNPIRIGTVNITTPLPGTKIWDIAKESGLVNEDMDWNSFFNPLDNPETQLYINEIVPHNEFIKIFKEFRSEIIKKSITNWSSLSLKEMIIKFFQHPKNNFMVLMKNKKKILKMIGGKR